MPPGISRPERHDRQRGDYFQGITKQIEAAGGNAEIAKAIVESIVDLAKLYTDPKAENAADTPTEIGGFNIGSFSSWRRAYGLLASNQAFAFARTFFRCAAVSGSAGISLTINGRAVSPRNNAATPARIVSWSD